VDDDQRRWLRRIEGAAQRAADDLRARDDGDFDDLLADIERLIAKIHQDLGPNSQ
jgi:hypothetical protein